MPDIEIVNILYRVLDQRLEGIPLNEIEEVESYMRRHYWDYIFALDMWSAPYGDCWILQYDEECKRDFLMYEINTKIENENIQILLDGIYRYIEDNLIDFLYETP